MARDANLLVVERCRAWSQGHHARARWGPRRVRGRHRPGRGVCDLPIAAPGWGSSLRAAISPRQSTRSERQQGIRAPTV